AGPADDHSGDPDCCWCLHVVCAIATQQLADGHRAVAFGIGDPIGPDHRHRGVAQFRPEPGTVARSLGASRPKAFLTVTLPQIKNSVLSAALLSFVVSLDEVVVALLIAGGDMATIPRRMFLALRDEIDPTIASISTILILLSILLLGLSQLLDRK